MGNPDNDLLLLGQFSCSEQRPNMSFWAFIPTGPESDNPTKPKIKSSQPIPNLLNKSSWVNPSLTQTRHIFKVIFFPKYQYIVYNI